MNETPQREVIPAGAVRQTAQPVLVDCGNGVGPESNRAISVIPLMEGDLVAGIEVRCTCGSSVVVECVYDDANAPALHPALDPALEQ